MKQIIFLLALTTLFASCGQVSSDDINQDIIETDYSLTYNSDQGKIEASGSFTIGGADSTFVKLDGPSNLRVNGNSTKLETTLVGQLSYVYKKSTTFNPNSTYRFDYTNRDGDVFTNVATLPSLITTTTKAVVENYEGITLDWQVDDPNDQANSFRVIINHNNGFLIKYPDHNVSAGSLEIKSGELSEFRGQTVRISACRYKKTKSINNPGAGGELSTSFCSKSHLVALLP